MTGWQLEDVAEDCPRRQRAPEREDLAERGGIDSRVNPTGRKDRLDFRTKEQCPARLRIEERPHAQPVSPEEERPLLCVPDGDDKLAIESLEAAGSELLVQVQDDFRISVRREPMAACLQVPSQLDVIEHFAVEDDPQGPVFVGDRLLTGMQIDDAQPCAAEGNPIVGVDAELVGTPVAETRQHAPHVSVGRWRVDRRLEDSGDAAHYPSSFLLIFPVIVMGSASRNSTYLGTMNSSRCARQCVCTSTAVSGRSVVMTAFPAWPRTASGTPTTAAATTPLRRCSTFSTSRGATFSPRVLMTSSLRLTK